MAGVIVDTSVWVEFLNRPNSLEKSEVERLLDHKVVFLTGVILAELFQGTKTKQQLDLLKNTLTALPCLNGSRTTWEAVGVLSFQLRRKGITLPLSDLFIATLALENEHEVYSLDQHFRRIPNLKLYKR